jgi:all-trans-retinol 13,14-reductase
MAGVLTASRMLGWRGYKVGKLLKSWKPGVAALSDVPATGQQA